MGLNALIVRPNTLFASVRTMVVSVIAVSLAERPFQTQRIPFYIEPEKVTNGLPLSNAC